MNIRKQQITAYRTQLALAVELKAIFEADMENDEKGAAFEKAAEIWRMMEQAGYKPRSFGADCIETGDETPEQIEEMLNY
jgi:hypothetical protein